MDKYKILICGKQNIIIDDFFHHLSDDFDLLTTSFRYEDIVKHVNLFHQRYDRVEKNLYQGKYFCIHSRLKRRLRFLQKYRCIYG